MLSYTKSARELTAASTLPGDSPSEPAMGVSDDEKVEPDARPNGVEPAAAADDQEQEYLKEFVEQYLASRGYNVCSRNARVIVAALADCRPTALDWSTLERCVDKAVDPELLRPAA